MYDTPDPADQLAAVAAFLREQVMPQLNGQLAFHSRVAANMLDIVARQWQLAPAAQADEAARLRALLGHAGDSDGDGDGAEDNSPGHTLVDLNRELCERIAAGRMGLHTPGLTEHLWRVTLDKLAVDQPRYETYLRTLP